MFTILKGNQPVRFNTTLFPGGEVGVRITETKYHPATDHLTIVARLLNANDVMALAMMVVKDKDNEYMVLDGVPKSTAESGALKEVFRDGKLLVDQSLEEIRGRIREAL